MKRLREYLGFPATRSPNFWLPYDFAKSKTIGSDPEATRTLAAEQFTLCLGTIMKDWANESTRNDLGKKLGEGSELSQTLAVRALIHNLYKSDYLGNYGDFLGDDTLELTLQHYIRFSEKAYTIGYNYPLAGFMMLGDIAGMFGIKTAMIEQATGLSRKAINKHVQSEDHLNWFFNVIPKHIILQMPLDFAKMMNWLFGSNGGELTERDRVLIATYLNLNTNFRKTTAEDFKSDDVQPLALLVKTLMKEGRDKTLKEAESVEGIVKAKFR